MLDLCAGFVYSQVLFACVRLRLFDILFKQPLTTAALAERLSLSPEVTCGIAAFSTWAVAKEFSSPRRQRGRRPYASCFSICPPWPSGLVPGSLMPDSWSELRSMAAIS
jgi:hypothetical protein